MEPHIFENCKIMVLELEADLRDHAVEQSTRGDRVEPGENVACAGIQSGVCRRPGFPA